jgi:phosphate-selective porin OprO/OprP
LTIGAGVQFDGRFSFDTPAPVVDTFSLRKLRPALSGRIARYFEFRFVPDFGLGTAVVQDAYFEIHFADALRVRTGKDKTPVGYETVLGDPYILFPERSLASSLLPLRDLGVTAHGAFTGGRIAYDAGVVNGIPDGTSSSPLDIDTNNGKDLAGRLVFMPFHSNTASPRPLGGLGFEIGGTRGTQHGSLLPIYRTTLGQAFFSYASGSVADGARDRESAAAFYYFKSLGAFSEYTRSAQTVTSASAATAVVANHAWDVTGSFVVTGEPTSERGVRPAQNFDPQKGHWGALQVMARYGALTVDDAAFTTGLAAAGSSAGAHAVGVGVNWYLNPYVRYVAAFEQSMFTAVMGVRRPAEHSLIFRAQLAF